MKRLTVIRDTCPVSSFCCDACWLQWLIVQLHLNLDQLLYYDRYRVLQVQFSESEVSLSLLVSPLFLPFPPGGSD